MTWVKIDDQFQDHPKFVGAPLATIGLWTAGLAYCNRYLTDGHINAAAVKRCGGTKKLIDDLVGRTLWRHCCEHDDCWVYHDYLDVQPSRDKVLETRDVRAEAGRRGGQARAKQLARQTAEQNGSTELSKTQARGASSRPVPSRPIEVTTSGDNSRRLSGGSRGDDDDGELSTAEQAVRLVSEHALTLRQSEKPDQPVRRPGRWLETDFAERWPTDGPIARTLAAQGRTAHEIADQLKARYSHPASPYTGLIPDTPIPQCDHCGQRHDGGCVLRIVEQLAGEA